MSPSAPSIVKADGEVEPFDISKLEASLRRTGAGEHTAREIAERIARSVGREVHTHEVYRKAFALLRKSTRNAAARYGLRRALLEFGPTGHPFEEFIAHLFKKEGWNVEWRKVMQGKCVPHEVDVYATREGEALAAELKYHNDPAYKTDIKVALYVQARFEDILNCDPKERTCPVDHGFLITNTKFTYHAIEYAKCSGLELLGWSYPEGDSLFDRITAAGIYPITALTLLKKSEKRLLIEQGIVACDMLRERRDALRGLSMPPERLGAVLAETDSLCAPLSV